MKPLKELTFNLLKVRLNQPRATLTEAQAQANHVMATEKKHLSSEEAYRRSIEILKEERDELEKKWAIAVRDMNAVDGCWEKKWQKILKTCCDAEAEVEHLQNIVEDLNFLVADVNENNSRLIEEIRRLTAVINGNKIINTKVSADYETRIVKLTKDLETTEANRKYACDHISQQNQLIRDVKAKMEEMWNENKTLKQEKVNGEHLAKKTVELHQQNVKLMQENSDLINQLIEKKSILEQTCQNLAKKNKEKDIIQHNSYVQEEESLKLHRSRQKATNALQEVIRMQRDALEIIARGSMFKHHKIAHECLKAVMKYKEANNLI